MSERQDIYLSLSALKGVQKNGETIMADELDAEYMFLAYKSEEQARARGAIVLRMVVEVGFDETD